MGRRTRAIASASRPDELRRLTGEIHEWAGRAGRAIYEMGRRLSAIRDAELYREDGHATMAAYVDAELPFSRRHARRLMRVAGHFSAAIAARYGVEKLDRALRVMEATPEEERPGDILAADLRIRGPRGRFITVPLHEASNTQIREALTLLREARKSGRKVAVPKRVRSRATALARALPPPPAAAGASCFRRRFGRSPAPPWWPRPRVRIAAAIGPSSPRMASRS